MAGRLAWAVDSAAHGWTGHATYAYDLADRITAQTANGVATAYTYDDTDQLTAAGAEAFAYDPNGNRTGAGVTIGAGNRVLNDGAWTYTHNDAGQTTTKSNGTVTWDYHYDLNGQLISATNGTETVTYKYDAFGNRIERTYHNGAATTTERYTHDGGDTAKPRAVGTENFDAYADLDGAGNVTTRRVYGAGFDELVLRRDVAGTVGWYLTDRQGSVRAIINSAGPGETEDGVEEPALVGREPAGMARTAGREVVDAAPSPRSRSRADALPWQGRNAKAHPKPRLLVHTAHLSVEWRSSCRSTGPPRMPARGPWSLARSPGILPRRTVRGRADAPRRRDHEEPEHPTFPR